jgi:hypothetical protein
VLIGAVLVPLWGQQNSGPEPLNDSDSFVTGFVSTLQVGNANACNMLSATGRSDLAGQIGATNRNGDWSTCIDQLRANRGAVIRLGEALATASNQGYDFYSSGQSATVDLGDTETYQLNLVDVDQGGLVVDGLQHVG